MERSRAESRALSPAAPHPARSRNTCRLFALCSIIVIIFTESPASGFTIPRDNITEQLPRDLSAEESTLLEVKNDLKRPNDLRNGKDKSDLFDTISLIQDSPNLSTLEDKDLYNNLFEKNIRSLKKLREQSRLPNEFELSTSPSTDNDITSGITSELLEKTIVTSSQEDVKIPVTSQSAIVFSTTELRNKEEKGITETIVSSFMPSPETYKVSEKGNLRNRSKEQGRNPNVLSSPYSLISKYLNTTLSPNSTPNNRQPINNRDEYIASYKESDLRIDKTSAIPEKKNVSLTIVDIAPNDTTVTDSIIELNDILYSTGASTSIEDSHTTPLLIGTQTEPQSFKIFTTGLIPSHIIRTDKYSSAATVEPVLINYTETERSNGTDVYNISSASTIASDNEMMNADSVQTRITLEKEFTATPISSLEQLRQNLISLTSQQLSSTSAETETVITQPTSKAISVESSSSASITSTANDNRDIVSSKRAGFLDFTIKTVPPENITTIVAVTTERTETNETDTYVTLDEIDMEGTYNKTASESLSQLAEDAIKEELLKEEQLIDHAENAERYREEVIDEIDGVRAVAAMPRTEDQVSREPVTEDTLSVKPINHEKIKNPSLYTVSPNYKPMKKIDVQPPKQFVRDPDDNSWRNESISSLGIVFKPKNSSKSFTQVLRNKTEIVLSNLSDSNKNDVPDLRVRLEKIAEVRKSKKKKIDKFGETVYTDYEESGESSTHAPTEASSSTLTTPAVSTSTSTHSPVRDTPLTVVDSKKPDVGTLTTRIPNKFFNIAEYYDSGDEYDAEYAKLSKIDLKKNPKPSKEKVIVTTPAEFPRTKFSPLPDRQPTVQYFPPRVHQKVNVNDYDDNFQKKINFYASKDNPKYNAVPFGTVPTARSPSANLESADREYTVRPIQLTPAYLPIDINKDLYYNGPAHPKEPRDYVAVNEGNNNKGSYVIKHYRDFLNEPAKDLDDDRNSQYRYTEPPVRGVTITEQAKDPGKVKTPDDDDYEYDNQFRKDILSRFVDNFNQNSERFKVDFPIVYNSSVVHSKEGAGSASSSAFMKRLYNSAAARLNNLAHSGGGGGGERPCEACDNVTVELSPAYELHYYVPDQEEREEVEPRPLNLPFQPRYRL